jgi:hypothetical protein
MSYESSERGNAAAWPTLEKQLAEANAPPGSPLAELIAENQDFSILRPDEANDGLRLPPWLRVLYKRNQPNRTFSATDPSGGYPQYLWTTLEWMKMHPDLPVQKGPEHHGSPPPSLLDVVKGGRADGN